MGVMRWQSPGADCRSTRTAIPTVEMENGKVFLKLKGHRIPIQTSSDLDCGYSLLDSRGRAYHTLVSRYRRSWRGMSIRYAGGRRDNLIVRAPDNLIEKQGQVKQKTKVEALSFDASRQKKMIGFQYWRGETERER